MRKPWLRCTALLALVGFAVSSCDNVDNALRSRIDQAQTALNTTIQHLSDVADQQRTKLAQDLNTLVDTSVLNLQALAEQAKQAADALAAIGQNLSEKATADLLATMASIQSMAQQLTTSLQGAVVDDIKRVSAEIDRQRNITLQQLNATVQGVMRPLIAQLTASGDHLVGSVERVVATLVVRIAGIALLLMGVIALLMALRRSNSGDKTAFVIVAVLLIVAGPVAVAFARPIGALGSPKLSIPSGKALCDKMVGSSAALVAAQHPTTPVHPALPAPPAPLARRSLRVLMRGGVVAAPAAVSAGSGSGASTVQALAVTALQDANQCITYATTAQMADLAAQDFTRALAVVTDTVFCHLPADCVVINRGCDVELGVCLPFGEYCETEQQCAASMWCLQHRCIPRDHACSVAADCAPNDACDPGVGHCVALADVASHHEPCTLPPPAFGPCSHGERQAVNRLVTCVQTVQASPETCDGVDNDCNGQTDDGLHTGAHCIARAAVGECANGISQCSNGQETCVPSQPTAELCDGKDNNCNGQTDEGLPDRGDCSSGLGECRAGKLRCVAGLYQCVSLKQSSPEVCDNKDNNCDGQTDENGACAEERVFFLANDERHAIGGVRENHTFGDNCGTDRFGRQRHRTHCDAHDAWDPPRRESHCEPPDSGFGAGWITGAPDDCRCQVHYGTAYDNHVKCEISIFGQAP